MARKFSEHGVLVDIVTRKSDSGYPDYQFVERDIRVLKVDRPWWIHRWFKRFVPRKAIGTVIDLWNLYLLAHQKFRKHHYDFVIGIDTMGLIVGNCAVWPRDKNNVKLVYWSLEISFMRDLTARLDRILKWLERMFARHVDMIIVQDVEREALLHEENKTVGVPTKFIPNGALGFPNWKKESFLHKLLGIDQKTQIVLHAGVISDQVRSLELAASARMLPENYILVFHEREKRNKNDPYLEQIRHVAGDQLRLSLNPVPLDMLDRVFASARIGVVLYSQQHGDNFSSVSFASGKLSYFLRNGVPVVVSDSPGFRRIIEQYRCGVIVDDLADIADMIRIIDSDYEKYSRNAMKCFDDTFEFGRKFDDAFYSWLGPRSKDRVTGLLNEKRCGQRHDEGRAAAE